MTRITAAPIPAAPANARRSLGLALLLALLVTLFGGLFSSPAHAAECTPDPGTACVQGVIKESTGDPAPGVELTLSGGGQTQSTETGSDGRWSFTVEEAGAYTVTVDEQSLPEGNYFRSAGSREVKVELGRSTSALFPLTDDPDAASAGGGDGDEAGTSGSGGSSANAFSWPRFWQQFVSGIRMGLLIALASLGLSLIFGTTGLSNFAHGEMVSLGGLLAAGFMGLTGNLWIAAVLAVAALAIFGWAQDKVLWKPLRKKRLSLMQLMIVSIGLSITMQFLFQFIWGSGVVRIDSATPATVEFFGIVLTVQSLIAMGISLAAIILVGLGLMYTRFGRATRAISDNPALARASGIDVDRIINVVWIVGGAMAGLAGVFFGLVFNGVAWFTGGQMLLLFFAAVTLGGLGTAFGAFIGSMIIGMMVELTNIWLPGDLKFATALAILILILLIRPQGIFGRKERIG